MKKSKGCNGWVDWWVDVAGVGGDEVGCQKLVFLLSQIFLLYKIAPPNCSE